MSVMLEAAEGWQRRAFAAEARIEALEQALRPFAKAGELFGDADPEGFDMAIYKPAAGDQYAICGNDLRRARAALAQTGEPK